MNASIKERKQKALEIMEKLDIYKAYIDDFKKANNVCYFENYIGFWAWQKQELADKIKELEEKHNCTVYAVTHEYTEFGECYDFLIVTDYKEEWNNLITDCKNNTYYVMTYVWNKDDEWCSEFGNIVIKSYAGGIRRIG